MTETGRQEYHPPFVHPRRDPYFRRARYLAAGFLTIVQAAWFVAFVVAIQSGTPLTVPVSLLGLAGILLIGSRLTLTIDIALGIVDRMSNLESAPDGYDIFRRFMPGIAAPFATLAVTFAGRERIGIVLGGLAVVILLELIYRLAGFARWRKSRIDFVVLKALLNGSLEE